MSQIIHLTAKLRLQLESTPTRDDFFQLLRDAISVSLGKQQVATELLDVIAVHDPSQRLTLRPVVEPVLDDFDAAASVWCVDDVLEVCPNLSTEDALIVLHSVTDRSDAYSGIQPHSFCDAIEGVLGIDPDTGRTLEQLSASDHD